MTPLGWFFIAVAIFYIGLASWSANRAYSKGFGDGFNYAADRSNRTITHLLERLATMAGRLAPVPASAEVLDEEARRS